MRAVNRTMRRMAGCVRTIRRPGRRSLLFPLLVSSVAAQTPEFVHGDECLFCHRANIGSAWQRNAHNLTTRAAETNPGEILLGRRQTRRLKKTGYNKLAFIDGKSATDFNRECARCHTTAVDPRDFTYAYLGLDCYACHGAVDLGHSTRAATVPLGKRAATSAGEVNALCLSCHRRSASMDAVAEGPDRHLYRAMPEGLTCLSCHSIHADAPATERHRRVLASAICNDCHFEGEARRRIRPYVARAAVCERP